MDDREKIIKVFSELGDRLDGFGKDGTSQWVIDQAMGANRWFSRNDILHAVDAVRNNMLREDVLRRWLASYDAHSTRPIDVAVIMAGNIPLVGFLDLLCVVASGNRCHMKTSSRDTALMEYLAGLLKDVWPDAPVVSYDGHSRYDAVIATGSDNTNRYFRAQFSEIPSLLRGSRYSAAVLTGSETEGDLAGLSRDIFMYKGMGCRNVSLLFVPGGYDIARLCRRVRPAVVSEGYSNNYRQTKALLSLQGRDFTDGGCFVLVAGNDFPAELSRINYCHYSSKAQVVQHLSSMEDRLQTVVSAEKLFPRRSGFGLAQRPYPWDYPDGKDVMEFIFSAAKPGI